MKQLKKLAGETVLYGMGSIVPRFLNFLLVPLHTAVFNPEEYGVITKLFAYVAVINIIFMFGMETAYFRYATKSDADKKRTFDLAQTIVVAISLLLSLILILCSKSLAIGWDIPGRANLIIWLVIIMFMDAIVAIPFARLRLEGKPTQFVVGKLANVLILVGLNVYFLKYAYNPSFGVGYVMLANLAANLFYFILFAKTLLSWRPVFDRTITPSMFSYAYPVMITGIAGMTNEMFSRVTLEWWLPENFYVGQSSAYALGIFGACYKFAMLMSLTVTAFRYAAEPFFFSTAADKNSPQLFAKVNHYFIIVCCAVLLIVGTNMDILKYFLRSEAYWEGLSIVPVLLLAYLFLGAYYNFSIWFKLTDKTYYGTIITVGGAILTIAANFFLIPVFGYWGSSLATLICYFSMAVLCYWLGQKFYPIPYSLFNSLGYIIVTTLIVYGVNALIFPSQWMATAFHILVVGLYIFILYMLEKAYFRRPVG
jgi:O-antigen/teichoic acid export membrane protein